MCQFEGKAFKELNQALIINLEAKIKFLIFNYEAMLLDNYL